MAKLDKHKFAEYMDLHAEPASTGYCAKYVRKGLEAGGLDTTGRPDEAREYGPFLIHLGAHHVPNEDYLGHEKLGDIVVIQPVEGHSEAGHIEMWDGQQWVSDFKQHHLSPYAGHTPDDLDFAVYRFQD